MVLMLRARRFAGVALGAVLGAALFLGGPVLPAPPLAPVPLAAQAPAPLAAAVQAQETAGWIGVRLMYQIAGEGTGQITGPILAPLAGPSFRGTLLLDRDQAIRVLEVVGGGPAHRGGLRAGDLLLRVDDQEAGVALREGHLTRVRPGQEVRFLVNRGSDEARSMELVVVAGVRPPLESPVAAVRGARSTVGYSTTVIRIPGAGSASESLRLAQPHFQVDSLVRRWVPAQPRGLLQPMGQSWNLMEPPRSATILVYASGQRVVLGAEVTPLNSGLAGYFGVDSGLLVTQVLEGAPAERAGLVPGDVIRFVGGAPVTTLEEFRRGADRGLQSPPLVLGVVREGRALELRLAR